MTVDGNNHGRAPHSPSHEPTCNTPRSLLPASLPEQGWRHQRRPRLRFNDTGIRSNFKLTPIIPEELFFLELLVLIDAGSHHRLDGPVAWGKKKRRRRRRRIREPTGCWWVDPDTESRRRGHQGRRVPKRKDPCPTHCPELLSLPIIQPCPTPRANITAVLMMWTVGTQYDAAGPEE